MMDFMESMRRGVDRAGFEVDRFLRANKVRSRINFLHSQRDEEEQRIGHAVVELYLRGERVNGELLESCERVRSYQAEIAQQESELERINQELAPPAEQDLSAAPGPLSVTCPNCGTTVPADSLFCLRCGQRLKSEPPPEQKSTGQ